MIDLFAPPTEQELIERKEYKIAHCTHHWGLGMILKADGCGKPVFKCFICKKTKESLTPEEYKDFN